MKLATAKTNDSFSEKKVEMKCAHLFPFSMIDIYFYCLHVVEQNVSILRLIIFFISVIQ
jgi:hypothetical protein